jgi:hypothetical protein
MVDTDRGALAFAADRLAQVLAQPVRCGEIDWGRRVQRALAGFRQALERHAAMLEAPDGLLGQIADRSLLPFTAASQQGARLRDQHVALTHATRLLEQQAEAVVGFWDLLTPPGEPDEGFRAQCQAGAFRALLMLAHEGEQLLAALRAHSAAEDELRHSVPDSDRAAPRRRRHSAART